MRTVVALGLVVALAGCGDKPAGAGAAGGGARGTGPRAFRISVQTVATQSITYAIDAIGSLEARNVVVVPARVSGVLDVVSFEEGDAVTRESVLAVIDGERFALEAKQVEAGIVRARAALESALARTAQANATLGEAKESLERRRGLREKNPGWVTQEELSAQESAVTRLEAGVDEARSGEGQARAAVEEAEARLEVARKDLADCRVLPPMDGIIERKRVSAGQFIREGDAVATIVDTSRLHLRFRVGESESVNLRPGLPVTFSVRPFPGREFEARLFHVNATADMGTRMVECLAEVEKPDPALKPGFFATVRCNVAAPKESVIVPEESLLPTERGFVAFVVVDGKASVRPLRLGLRTREGNVEVIEGLRAGEVLAVEGARALEDGVPVMVVPGVGAAAKEAAGGEEKGR